MTAPTVARNADLSDLAEILKTQHAAKLDIVAPAAMIQSIRGFLVVTGAEPLISDSGVTEADGVYRPTAVFDEGVADKLGVPVAFLKRMRAERTDIYDEVVNRLLHGGESPVMRIGAVDIADGVAAYQADDRSFLVRLYRDAEGGIGVARALLSTSYRMIDNLDVLTAALEGVRASGVEVEIDGCDLTERRMRVRIAAPAVSALAPVLLANYRSPFDQGVQRAGGWRDMDHLREVAARENPRGPDDGLGGRGGMYEPGREPVVFGGFEISNSETGGGAFTLTPRLIVKVCRNGLTITVDALREIHLGSRLEEGVIRWSVDTQERNLELVASQARDAVGTFLDPEYVARKVQEIEEKAGARIERPVETIQTVARQLRFSAERTEDVLAHFTMGGQLTAGGVLQAITSVAQTIEDPDDAAEFEALGIRALDLAAAG